MKRNKKGFTLAELLIVVAIIAVLVAIAIPVFTGSLAKANVATNQANARAAYAAITADMLDSGVAAGAKYTYDVGAGKATPVNGPTASFTSEITVLNIGEWTKDNAGSLSASRFNSWYFEIGAAGNVTKISYGQ